MIKQNESPTIAGTKITCAHSHTILYLAILLFVVCYAMRAFQLRQVVRHASHRIAAIGASEDYLRSLVGKPLFGDPGATDAVKEIGRGAPAISTELLVLLFQPTDCRQCLREIAALNGLASQIPRPIRTVGVCIGCQSASQQFDELMMQIRFPVVNIEKPTDLRVRLPATPYRLLLDSDGNIRKVKKLEIGFETEQRLLAWIIE